MKIKKLTEEFAQRDFYGKLSIIADLVGILGVSIFTIATAPFISRLLGVEITVADVLGAALFASVWIAVIFFAIDGLLLPAFVELKTGSRGVAIVGSIVFLFLLAAIVGPVKYYVLFVARVTENEIFKPAQPTKVVSMGPLYESWSAKEAIDIAGSAIFRENADHRNYVVVCYFQRYGSPSWNHFTFSGKQSVEIRRDGKFYIPAVAPRYFESGERISKISVVVVRRADTDGFGQFPDYLDDEPVREFERFGAVGAVIDIPKPPDTIGNKN